MSNSQELLQKIANLRQQLQDAEGLVREASQAALVLLDRPPLPGELAQLLGQQVTRGAAHDRVIDVLTRQATGQPASPEITAPSLTPRSARVLQQGRDLLSRLRDLAADPMMGKDEHGTLPGTYRDTVAMIDFALRATAGWPNPPSAQGRLCAGLEPVLETVAQRVGVIQAALEQRRQQQQRLQALAQWLHQLAHGEKVSKEPLLALAHGLWQEACRDAPLRFMQMSGERPAEFVAGHALTVAQVLARLLRHDADWRQRWPEALLAALVYDVGLLLLPPAILAQPGPMNEDQRRRLASHTQLGADLLQETLGSSLAVEAALGHHERLDGTGYPAGLPGSQQSAFVRLLALCDVYAALCCRRPHRPALDTRTALTETLLLADRGTLDRPLAKKLLCLSFFPVGTVVELTDGSLGLVVAAQRGPADAPDPARPVVALLADSSGELVLCPRYRDLAEPTNGGIARILPAAERRHRLGKYFPLLGHDD